MRVSAEEVSPIAAGRGFARNPVARMIRLFDAPGQFAGDEATGLRMARERRRR